LRIDLDPGLGRTGLPISVGALDLAARISEMGLFGGWHVYDGHVQDVVREDRERRLAPIMEAVRDLMKSASEQGISTDLIAGGSYSYNIWPADLANWVSPGSFTYSSSQHNSDLADAGWQIAAYVLSTVLSMRNGTATLDAGSKAISPDIPLVKRFVGAGAIRLMKEEHAVVESSHLHIGDRVPLVPRHACTAAYLYSRALVRLVDGTWEYRDQLGVRRESVGALDV
jgi:3-hydroxy-D-aspartate aldolase